MNLFTAYRPSIKYPNPAAGFIQIDTTTVPHTLLESDIYKNRVIRFDQKLNPVDSFHTNGPVVNIDISHQQMIACDIGVLNPNNGKFGK